MQDEVIYRYLTGKCSPEEETRLMEWYQEDPETHQRDIDRVRLIFEGMLVHQVIGAMENRPKRIWTLRKMVRYSAGIAAGLILLPEGCIGCVRTPMMKYRLNSPLLRHRPDNV